MLPDRMMKDISKLRCQTVNQVMKEVHQWRHVTLDKVMAKVAVEREAFISQFMNRLIGEQKNALEVILAEEQQLTELVTELRKAVEGGDTLLLAANTLTDKFNIGELSEDSKTFEIKRYQETIAEVTTLVESTNRLANTVGLEQLVPRLINAIDQVEAEGEELIDHSFRQGVMLILIAMGAYIIARLMFNFLNRKLIESRE
jgi:hypothetical protein